MYRQQKNRDDRKESANFMINKCPTLMMTLKSKQDEALTIKTHLIIISYREP